MKKILFSLPVVLLIASGCNTTQPTSQSVSPSKQTSTQTNSVISDQPQSEVPTSTQLLKKYIYYLDTTQQNAKLTRVDTDGSNSEQIDRKTPLPMTQNSSGDVVLYYVEPDQGKTTYTLQYKKDSNPMQTIASAYNFHGSINFAIVSPNAVVSPNGQLVAYISDVTGKDGIFLKQVVHTFSINQNKETGAFDINSQEQHLYSILGWAADNTNIYLSKGTPPDTDPGLYSMNSANGNIVLTTNSSVQYAMALMSPDGNYLAYIVGKGESADYPDQFKMLNLKTGTEISVSGPEDPKKESDVLAWSLDSKKILWSSANFDQNNSYNKLMVYDISTNKNQELLNVDINSQVYPAFWIDNNTIIYGYNTSTSDGNSMSGSVNSIKADGSDKRVLIKENTPFIWVGP